MLLEEFHQTSLVPTLMVLFFGSKPLLVEFTILMSCAGVAVGEGVGVLVGVGCGDGDGVLVGVG